MRRLLLLALLTLALSPLSKGQTTTVSGTVTDQGGQAWINGTYSFTSFAQGQPVTSGLLDATASFAGLVFPINNQTNAVGNQWTFQACPDATSGCFSKVFVFGGGVLNLSSGISPPAILMSISIYPGAISTPRAYNDNELNLVPKGGIYFNTTLGAERMCVAVTSMASFGFGTCNTWISVPGAGGSGGSGTPGFIPLWVTPATLGNSAWTDTLTQSLYHGTGGIGTNSLALTGTPPFSAAAVEGPHNNCLPITDAVDSLCSLNDLTPAGLWLSHNGAAYKPICVGASCGISNLTQLISGGGVAWTGVGLTFTVSAATYTINGQDFTSPQTNVTLAAADPTNPRIDVIEVDNTGTVGVITGTPAPSPSTPVPNPLTQLGLSSINVAANATTPTLNNILVYDENVGTPTEWNCTPTANINCNSTNNPYSFTHDIEATLAVAGNNVVLANTSTVNLSSYSTVSFNIRNKATWPAAKVLTICFQNGAVVVGQCVGFKNGVFGFNQANTTSYQQIVIPLAQFALTGVVDRITFTVAGTGAGIGFYLDLIQIQNPNGGTGSAGTAFILEVNGTNTQKTTNLINNASITWSCATSLGFSTCQATAIGAPPSGTAGGALAGTYPNPTLANGTACTNQVVTAISQATAAGTCASVSNAMLVNPATTVNGQTCTLGSTCTVTATPTAGTISHGLVFPVGDPTNVTALTTSSVSFYVTIPFGCTINAYNLAIDAGTVTVKFWKITTGTAIPTAANSINTSGVSISSGTAIHSATVTDFTTTTVAANDIMAMAVTAVSGAHQVTGVLSCTQ